ncbi:ankyrin repeat-containing domain protein [Aspergillus caelatus]|uniref:Ankyrin repeat-containing domain protein n=1 Tax=Aspergillus caelatus TaxID=61420 RepID=A0A5N7ALN8_9EURO|nr:ankyrin repeat-containing domain protein [Aspergillus caelatus]KAE8370156.1 ankyrin repeat-containing domain protein [Aspergillus caelatus]
MARSKEEEAEWASHRDELQYLWLDQRWSVQQIRAHMTGRYNFCKSQDQYSRQFRNWNLKKNAKEEEWRFIAHSRHKRKREGKDPGEVSIRGTLIPEPKVRKETARYVSLSSQYLELGDSDPKTPEGIIVSTPRASIEDVLPEIPMDLLEIDWSHDLIEAATSSSPAASGLRSNADGMPLASPIEIPPLSPSGFHVLADGQPTATLPNENIADLDHNLQSMLSTAQTSMYWGEPIQCDSNSLIDEIIGQARLALSCRYHPKTDDKALSECLSFLEPITIGDVRTDLTRKAESIFQSRSSDILSHYLSLCVYLSSNNMLSTLSTDKLISLIVKSRSQLRLKTLLHSKTTTMEIFMSNLLASAAAMGEIEICEILINAGADIDAPSGLGSRRTSLHRALCGRQLDCVRMLLDAGADPNLAVDGMTPLHLATELYGSYDSVKVLLDSGAHAHPPQDSARLTPLQLAVKGLQTEVIRLLLEAKANPNSFTTAKRGTALQIACGRSEEAGVVELLIEAGADIDSRSGYRYDDEISEDECSESSDDESDISSRDSLYDLFVSNCFRFKSPILIAAENENWEAVQLLLEEGAAVNPSMRGCPIRAMRDELLEQDWDYPAVFTPLQAAIRAQNITMTRMLLSAGAHVDARPRNKYGHTALQTAVLMGNERLAQILLRKGANVNAAAGVCFGRTALQAASAHSDTALLSILLEAGADVNALPAREGGRTALQVAVRAGNIEGVRLLLDAGAAVNTDASRMEGTNALQEVTKIQDQLIREEMLHLLLRAGAYIQPPKGQEKYASLHTAVSEGNLDVTKNLLRKGASPNMGYCAHTNCTPLQKASELGNESLFQVLVDYGANISARPYWDGGRTALQSAAEQNHLTIVKMLLQLGASVKEERAVGGISVMEAAVKNCNLELIRLLLDMDPSIISSDPNTKEVIIGVALHHWKCDMSLLELLLNGGADVNNVDTVSSLPFLQLAARQSNLGFVQCLLTRGAIVNRRWQPTFAGAVTALQEAVQLRHIDMVHLLLEWGADINAPANEKGGKTALQTAVSQNNFEMVDLLVKNGANVNGLPSPRRGRTALQEAASSGYVQMTQYLLNLNADINARAAHFGGITALQGAASSGNIRIVMMLLCAGVDINGAPAIEHGRNAIESAAENGRLDTLHLLLNYHPNTEEFDIKRKRAAKLALANGHLAIGRFLLAYRKDAWMGTREVPSIGPRIS